MPLDDPTRPLIAGNWKMNLTRPGAEALAGHVCEWATLATNAGIDVLICPASPLLGAVAGVLSERTGGAAVLLGAQDCHAKPAGAHTGDASAPMLASIGCRAVIVGHSERRRDHGETDAVVRAKAQAAMGAGLHAIVCIGETLAERDAGRTLEVVMAQLAASLPETASAATLTLAYEPVWAIGTGRTPGVSDVAAVHAAVRAGLQARPATAAVRILYGGSVTPDNAAELLGVADVGGALIGGASLKSEEFRRVSLAAAQIRR